MREGRLIANEIQTSIKSYCVDIVNYRVKNTIVFVAWIVLGVILLVLWVFVVTQLPDSLQFKEASFGNGLDRMAVTLIPRHNPTVRLGHDGSTGLD